MRFREWFRPPRNVLAIFVAVAIVSAGALAWLVWLLIEQERVVEIQRRQERLEQAADRAAAVMQGALANLELQLGAPEGQTGSLPPGVAIVKVGADGMSVRPKGGILYYPEAPHASDVSLGTFAEGEAAEFAGKDLDTAARLYSHLSTDPNMTIRGGALMRLARVRRKLRDFDSALEAYSKLSQVSARVSGLPASLIAREGRASIFADTGRKDDLQREAAAFDGDLGLGRWQLTKSEYEFYRAEARGWMGSPVSDDPEAVARSEAFASLWESRHSIQAGSRHLIEGSLVISSSASSNDFNAAIAGPSYLASLCREAIPDRDLRCTISDSGGHPVTGEPAPARLAVMRTAAAAKLPWSLEVFSAADSDALGMSPQRRLLLGMIAVLALVWCTGAYFVIRAISRELRVARLQSDFVAAVSHEFRSPLSSLCQISEMLAQDRLTSEEQRRKSYGVLAGESLRLRRLVEHLLDFGRFEAGAAAYHFESLELGAFLRGLIADFQDRVAELGYDIELNRPAGEIFVRADREALSRAVWNLLDNAVKYSPEYRTVWVEVERNDDRISIAVCDRGLGIPVQEQHAIFEKFVRGAESKALRIKGTGIGLAMVRHIMQAHGGEILLASEPGRGSRFTMVFPS